jgi:DNA-binding MarR family transcriptional regulator
MFHVSVNACICADADAQGAAMTSDIEPKPELCNCSALRQAARHVTRFYDAFLFPAGLRTTQFSILAKLRQRGPLTITALAAAMVMDRTTLGRNIRPLQRRGLVAIASGRRDHRSKEMHLTETGLELLRAAGASWREAKRRFDALLGVERTSALRKLLHTVSVTDLASAEAAE